MDGLVWLSIDLSKDIFQLLDAFVSHYIFMALAEFAITIHTVTFSCLSITFTLVTVYSLLLSCGLICGISIFMIIVTGSCCRIVW